MKQRTYIADSCKISLALSLALLSCATPAVAQEAGREQELDRLIVNLGIPEAAKQSLATMAKAPELQAADPVLVKCILNVYSASRIASELRSALVQVTEGSPYVSDLNRFYESSAGKKVRNGAIAAAQSDAVTGQSTQNTFMQQIVFTAEERAQLNEFGKSGAVELLQRVQQSASAAQPGVTQKLQDEALRTCSASETK